ncbi:GTPase HflX [Futiania mangrovi]|uniref:GTPase HflX n=1 Tax=Futiania mangrovi TaxID=2959716 RepID=A0A9J6PC14_9PROT|nr:GTPase HflX [Futiania mangrovii]MCP1335774.1 GTPase HflX [Futiania mangrovii]
MSTRACVLHPALKRPASARAGEDGAARDPRSRLEEAVGLTEAIGVDIVHAAVVPLDKVKPGTVFGEGKVDELAELIHDREIALVVIDSAVTPVQQRNLERRWKAKVVDRTGLILEIFGERAATREGALQVELAHLTYQKSRLVRSWTHLERQRGGTGFLGGPGETQIEADRRVLAEKITRLKKQLDKVARTREEHRKTRRKVPYPVVALVGYTNAGKSTLFNTMTRAEVVAKDMLFATLDPTMRAIVLPGTGQRIILSDTVGFISDLPVELVAAFRATLEEVLEADLILHVRDISHPETLAQRADVLGVLDELGVDTRAQSEILEVLNKIDRLPEPEREAVAERAARDPSLVAVSALTGEGMDALLDAIAGFFRKERRLRHLAIPADAGEALAWLYRKGEVQGSTPDEETGEIHLDVLLSEKEYGQLLKEFPSLLKVGSEA